MPLSSILKEAVNSCNAIGDGIETYPVGDYILYSVFLKMTGAQEQKMKCIVWELASDDYDYRYCRYTRKPYGECSSYDEKNKIYKDLIDQIKKNDDSFSICNVFPDGKDLIAEAGCDIDDIFKESGLVNNYKRQYKDFCVIRRNFNIKCCIGPLFYNCAGCSKKSSKKDIGNEGCAMSKNSEDHRDNINLKDLKEIYKPLYNYRNQCAHNTVSCRDNLPAFTTLQKPDYKCENYFFRFMILIIIDKIFIKLFDKYCDTLDKKVL